MDGPFTRCAALLSHRSIRSQAGGKGAMVRATRMIPGKSLTPGDEPSNKGRLGGKCLLLRERLKNRRAEKASSRTPTQPCRILAKRKLSFSISREYLSSQP